jgi:3-oxoacyl-[acyl-carrier protein] reductase
MGFQLALHCRNHRENAEKLARDFRDQGRQVSVISFDVSDPAEADEVLSRDISENGAYWGVVLNAGITRDAAFPGMSHEDWQQVLDTNLGSFYNVLRPCIMPMIRLRDGGRIVVVSSVSGISGNRGQTNYSASKAGLIAAAKSLAVELGKRRITVNSVAPGVIDTGMVSEELRERVLPLVPLGRIGNPEDVAGTVAFLCSEDAGYITRQVISVNGGMC